MRKQILFTLLTLVMGVLGASAYNVRIQVDTPANVTIQTQSGYGQTIDLTKEQPFTLGDNDNPLLITANEGAKIVSITLNDQPVSLSNDGVYRVGITGDSMVKITTSGTAVGGGDVVSNVTAGIYAMGEGITGKPFTISYEKDNEWIVAEASSMGNYEIPENATVKVTPQVPYVVDKITDSFGTEVETVKQEDGSLTFTMEKKFDYQMLYVYMSLSPDAIKFTIDVDYAANLNAAFRNDDPMNGERTAVALKDGLNTIVCLKKASPIEFFGTDGAKVVAVSKNGEPLQEQSGWVSGWIFEFEANDAFVVKTQGKPVDVKLTTVEATDAPLGAYTYTSTDGTTYNPTGMEATIKAHVGEKIMVAPRPGTSLSYLWTTNGGKSDGRTYFICAEGTNGTEPMSVYIYGTQKSGVTIKVADPTQVKVTMGGGRGKDLTLTAGENTFNMTDIENPLAFSAAKGNQIMSVNLNGDDVAVSTNGDYLVEVKDHDYITVEARKNPVDVKVYFMTDYINGLTGQVEGVDVEITDGMTIKTYQTLTLRAAKGYLLAGVIAKEKDVTITPIEGGYNIVVNNADINAVHLALTHDEQQPQQGYSIVIPNTNGGRFTLWEMTSDENEGTSKVGDYYYVNKLEANTVNEVKIGHVVYIKNNDSQSLFKSVTVNGKEIEFDKNTKTVIVEITDATRKTIDITTWTPLEVYTSESYDDVKLVKSGDVFFRINGELVKRANVEVGDVLEVVAVPEKGYKCDKIERFWVGIPTGEEVVDGKYTITENDLYFTPLCFKGTFSVDESARSYVIKGSTAYLMDKDGNINTGVEGTCGHVGIQWNDGNIHNEYTGLEGEEINLFVVCNANTQEEAEEFFATHEVAYYCLSKDFPNNKMNGAKYVINSEDANDEGVIWVNAVVKEKETDGINSVDADAADNDAWYTLQGVRIAKPAAGGVYIHNGKKVMVK